MVSTLSRAFTVMLGSGATPLPRSIRLLVLLAATALIAGAVAVSCGPSVATPSRVDLILVPHPDDELEAWSLIEDRPDVFHIFAYATLGEESSYCAPDHPGFQEGTGERRPRSMPDGVHSDRCEDERIGSTLLFIDEMAKTDNGLPRGLNESSYRVSPVFRDRGTPLVRVDGDAELPADRTARIYDGGEQGMVVFWDMGDGDLTRDEVLWIVETTVANRGALGIPDLPWGRLVGAAYFDDGTSTDCLVYTHPDHEAVHDAFWSSAFPGFTEQVAPTCRRDPRVRTTGVVAHFDDAMRLGDAAPDGHRMRFGAHNIHYGWLKTPYFVGDAEGQGETDGELLHRHQYFWVQSP